MTASITALVVLAVARPSRERALGVLVSGALSSVIGKGLLVVRALSLSRIDARRASTDPSHDLSSGRHEPQLPHRSSAEHAGGCRAAA
jgi:hypothetical protein